MCTDDDDDNMMTEKTTTMMMMVMTWGTTILSQFLDCVSLPLLIWITRKLAWDVGKACLCIYMHSDCIRSYRKRQKGNLFLLHVRCRRVSLPDVISPFFPHLICLSSSSFLTSSPLHPSFHSHFLNLLNVFRLSHSGHHSFFDTSVLYVEEEALFRSLNVCTLDVS